MGDDNNGGLLLFSDTTFPRAQISYYYDLEMNPL